MSFKREHKYNLEIYEERLYKEVMYDARPSHAHGEELQYGNPLKKAKARNMIRNMHEKYDEIKEIVQWPVHKRMSHKMTNIHEKGNEKSKVVNDPYHWVEKMTEAQAEEFASTEGEFTRMLLMKYHQLDQRILREYAFYQ